MYNELLGDAIRTLGITLHGLAEVVGVADTTVERWYYESRIPRPVHRALAAEALGVTEADLWPDAPEPRRRRKSPGRHQAEHLGVERVGRQMRSPRNDVLEVFVDLTAVPAEFLPTLIRSAQCTVHIASDSQAFLDELGLNDEGVQEEWSETALDVRILLPRSLNWRTWQQLAFTPVELRFTDDLSRSAYLRVDDYMIVVGSYIGLATRNAPALLLKRDGENGVFDSFLKGFDDAWTAATLDRLFAKHRNSRH